MGVPTGILTEVLTGYSRDALWVLVSTQPLPGGREDVVDVEPLRLAAVTHAHCPLLGLSGKRSERESA
jgi:hypothetical protein